MHFWGRWEGHGNNCNTFRGTEIVNGLGKRQPIRRAIRGRLPDDGNDGDDSDGPVHPAHVMQTGPFFFGFRIFVKVEVNSEQLLTTTCGS